MPKVKLAKIYGRYTYSAEDYYSDQKWLEEVVGFVPEEEVSYEDYELLKSYVKTYNKTKGHKDSCFFVLVSVVEPDEVLILEKTHKEFLEAERKQREKQEEAERKRKESLAAKALETKRKKLEKLKKELGEVA